MVAVLAYCVVVVAGLAGALGATPPRNTHGAEPVRNVAIIGTFQSVLLMPVFVWHVGSGNIGMPPSM